MPDHPAPQVEFFFDPMCPFCWVTSVWMRTVQRQRGIDIHWRFISLAMLNEGRYDDKPEGYPEGHRRGLEMLRVAAAARAGHGPDVVGNLYAAMGAAVWDQDSTGVDDFTDVLARTSRAGDLQQIVAAVGLPPDLAAAADEERWDAEVRSDTEEALRRAGEGLGTPILSFDPPDGPAFFGPVISEPPSEEDAGTLYDAVTTLAHWPGFAELKRSLREFPVTPLTANLARQTTRVG